MLKKNLKFIVCIAFLCLCLMLIFLETLANNNPQQLKSSIKYGDFEITFTSSQYNYSINAFMSFQISVNYIGEEESKQIWHGNEICTISLTDSSSTPLEHLVMHQELLTSVLTKDIPYVYPKTIPARTFQSGLYTATAYVEFSLDEHSTEKVECNLTLPLVIN